MHLSSKGVGIEVIEVIRAERRKEKEIMKSKEGKSQLSREERIRW